MCSITTNRNLLGFPLEKRYILSFAICISLQVVTTYVGYFIPLEGRSDFVVARCRRPACSATLQTKSRDKSQRTPRSLHNYTKYLCKVTQHSASRTNCFWTLGCKYEREFKLVPVHSSLFIRPEGCSNWLALRQTSI